MKKQDLFKFSLTAICVAVLSACGSSGGGAPSVNNTNTTPSANTGTTTNNNAELTAAQQAAAEAAAKQAAAEKAAAEAQAAAEKAAAEKAAAEQAAAEAAKKAAEDLAKAQAAQAEAVKQAAEEAAKKALEEKAAADKAAAEAAAAAQKAAEEAAKAAAAANAANEQTNPFGAKDQLTAEPDTTRNVSFVGFKQTVKVNSNLATNKSTGKDSTSDVPTPMAVQNLHPSLDTIVVAEPKDNAAAARVYVEDFDTRFINADIKEETAFNKVHDTNKNVEDNDSLLGNRALFNIYLNKTTTEKTAGNPVVEQQRAALKDALEKARTALKDKEQAALKLDRDSITNPVATKPDAGQDELGKLNAAIAAIPTRTYEGATAEQQQAFRKAEYDALYAKVSALKEKVASLQKDVDAEKAKIAKAQFDLNTFTTNNPEPEALKLTERTTETGKDYATKTKTVGTDSGKIWIFAHDDVKNKHQNFTEQSSTTKPENMVKKGFVYKGKDYNGNITVEGFDINNVKDINGVTDATELKKAKVQARNLDTTVAEVYGYRSKAMRQTANGFTSPVDVLDYSQESATAANNLPLVNDYYGAKLHNVQYGRVTTALDSKAATEDYLKKGLVDGNTPTFIASFGEYGKPGTENHYFYRGINNVGAKELELLKADPKNGTITYNGHAVAYGLNNNYRGDSSIPNALGAQAGFVSGNHATLTVNLGNNQVNGSIYNKWYDSVNSPDKLRPVSLVDLTGVIADNGNIAGTALRRDNNATGVFGATLFGNGQEVGGSFASDKHGKDEQWGGVFAGIRDAVDVEAPQPPSMATGTDKKN